MSITLTKAPFRADHVGSLLRPKHLLEARTSFNNGEISAEQLREIELTEVRRIVDKQIEVGLTAVTDGEFRRNWWHTDFMENLLGMEGYTPEKGYQFSKLETDKHDVRAIDRVRFNPDHPFIQHAKDLVEIVGDRAVAKVTIPSPNQFFNAGIINPEIYTDWEDFAKDIIEAYRLTIKAFYEMGVRYLQIDDVYIAGLSAPSLPFSDAQFSREYLIDLALRVVNGALEGKPEDLYVTTHICRGNYRSDYAFAGSYDIIAPTLLAREKVDGFFLEFDDERSGTFEPLRFIPNGEGAPRVVLGLFTSKFPELEDKNAIKERIKEATQFIPLEQLCISPQCGFASTHHGNNLTEEEQWEKLKLIVEVAKEVWDY
ncbi:5-methyltetrahydropteroyltriglutamate--homocysteine methyltransferase [Mesobacillus campisalis]|uniref:5-methyltetrahydropteroyltriglutamate--homocysteine methyltransferase n=1 Tax=Mesobacillus campisalis TaxID=1408103 RepID=A0A0M2SQ98_9BACI|nr:5-methyltetrahydropteroyltriglutamate--homocysteine S-methyltransferase [Mesobacillus campisalis]KKK36744.1 5-methyltetrahydropteroyltriglutamate--homocysteine methyltransferase [Mesobacillus campisalis]